jgi:hypothetical protein
MSHQCLAPSRESVFLFFSRLGARLQKIVRWQRVALHIKEEAIALHVIIIPYRRMPELPRRADVAMPRAPVCMTEHNKLGAVARWKNVVIKMPPGAENSQ